MTSISRKSSERTAPNEGPKQTERTSNCNREEFHGPLALTAQLQTAPVANKSLHHIAEEKQSQQTLALSRSLHVCVTAQAGPS